LKVKLIDFDKYELSQGLECDQNIIVGLKYILWFLNKIYANNENHEIVMKEKNLGIFRNFENIPQ
jgi:hypothetical protein